MLSLMLIVADVMVLCVSDSYMMWLRWLLGLSLLPSLKLCVCLTLLSMLFGSQLPRLVATVFGCLLFIVYTLIDLVRGLVGIWYRVCIYHVNHVDSYKVSSHDDSFINIDTCIFRPHRLHTVHRYNQLPQMAHVAWSVCLSVCVLVTRVSCAKTTEPIEMPFAEPCVRWTSRHAALQRDWLYPPVRPSIRPRKPRPSRFWLARRRPSPLFWPARSLSAFAACRPCLPRPTVACPSVRPHKPRAWRDIFTIRLLYIDYYILLMLPLTTYRHQIEMSLVTVQITKCC